MNLTHHPASLIITGPELLELGQMQARGEVVINTAEVGYSKLEGTDSKGRRKTRHVPTGYTVALTWPHDAPPPVSGPDPARCCAFCVAQETPTMRFAASGHDSATTQARAREQGRPPAQRTGQAAGARQEMMPWE